jgi:ribosome-binding protein aMBF1 (putative translation factor)
MSPEQVRAARGWLGWSQKDLADKAHVGLSTLKDFENGNRIPIANNLSAIQMALEAAGVALMFDKAGKAVGISVGKWIAKT